MHTYSFEKLEVYQLSLQFSTMLRPLLLSFPSEERFGLTSQLRRSADSISANLAEGSGRASVADRAHFTNIAYSSGLETINHLNLALRLQFVDDSGYQYLREQIEKILNKLNALYKHQLKEGQNLKNMVK